MAKAKKKPAAKRRATTQKDTGQQDPEVTEGLDKIEDNNEDNGAVEEYQPHHPTLQNAGFDHQAAEEKRQAELAEEREAHNKRTGDASRASWA
jgi:hypothetical protein